MRRLVLVCALAVTVAGMAAGVVSASSPHAKLRGFVCKHALLPMNREVSVTAVMRPVAGTRRMSLKFELIGKNKRTGKIIHVKAGDLGHWIKPDDRTLGSRPGDVWIFSHPVKDVAAPVSYRFHVHFRWTGQRGRTISQALRISRPCKQPELRPDLSVASIQVKSVSGHPGTDRYIATIHNGGRTAAGAFQVAFSDRGSVQKVTVQGLAARTSIKQTFVGPACSASSPAKVTVDPAHHVPDFNPANNSMVTRCS